MILPNISEQYAAHIPALKTLMVLGWQFLPRAAMHDLRPDNSKVVLETILLKELQKRRFEYQGQYYPLSPNSISQIVRDLTAPLMENGLLSANEKLYNALLFGVAVTEFINGKKHVATIPIIDWHDVQNNSFIVTEEFEVLALDGVQKRRPDIVCFVNGLPLVVIEAKKAASGNPNKSMIVEGISQSIRNQRSDEIPHLFAYSQLLLSINSIDGRYATTGTSAKFWANWQEQDFDEAHFDRIKNAPLTEIQLAALLDDKPKITYDYFKRLWAGLLSSTNQDKLIISLLSPDRLLEFIRFFIIFDKKLGKIAARYQQVFGVKALINRVSTINSHGGREGGVIWHTTGSGKSFTMVYLCKALLLLRDLSACRILVVTDRIDLENQLARTFSSGGALGLGLSQDAAKAKAATGRDLAERIAKGNERIIFTLIHKFATATKLPECHSDDNNLIVLVDEGHRSHGGENHQRMKHALPNAAFIAFTGTPLLHNEKTTNKFGPIIHAYTMQQAVKDGTVTPLLYEERQPIINVNDKAIDNWFDKYTASLSDEQKSDLKQKYSSKDAIYRAQNRIELIALDIATHFDENFKQLSSPLKGQLAVDGKISAIRYKKALDDTGLVTSAIIISPPETREGHEEINVTQLPLVQQWWKDNIKGNAETYERETIEAFGQDGAPDILIVVEKLLTGFDEPKNAVLYIDKSLHTHNLIQAIARVNRLHDQKKYGLLIDYRGILKELDTAIVEYHDLAQKTQSGFDIDDLSGLYSDVSTQYKRLPALLDKLNDVFVKVKNKKDFEQYRQLLIPSFITKADGSVFDENQKIREDFYEALTNFALAFKIAISSQSFYEDKSFSEDDIANYKNSLKFYSHLRKIAKQDAQETVDFSLYDEQIRKLVDRHVVGEDIKEPDGVLIISDLDKPSKPEEWSKEKLRNETDLIRSRLTKTIEEKLAFDPYAKTYFSQLLRKAIEDAKDLFNHPFKQFNLFEELEQKINKNEVDGIPKALENNRRASAFYGILKLEFGDEIDGEEKENYINLCFNLDDIVQKAVAENSLNSHNIDAAIKTQILPMLFKQFGLDKAKEIQNKILQIVHLGFQGIKDE
ncbi:type I restriction endonuclease subunit R [Bartonella sp. HY406]|uniref:type I restriction endonuclease subunit R n=1 Tax=Bartonella sp. HY406 TaxID=2979331 RepID=UPI0021C60F6D|nr:HsdR family type I site-specific deoxyribonuclease [Bartonella sp. HY406]UXN05114.1 HsdR family type I site-specific deoxyribonuclease [Bartonella sp. HY406]